MKVRIGPSRTVDFIFSMPPSLPMVSLVRSYVCAVCMCSMYAAIRLGL